MRAGFMDDSPAAAVPANHHDLLAMAVAAARDMSRFDDPQALMRVAQTHGRRPGATWRGRTFD